MRSRPSAPIGLIALAVLLGTPASAQDSWLTRELSAKRRAEILLTMSAPPAGYRNCRVHAPAITPGELLDSAAIVAELEPLGSSGARGTAVIQLNYDSAGATWYAGTHESELDSATTARLEQLLREHTRAAPKSSEAIVAVRVGGSPIFRVGGHEMCRPEMVNPEVLTDQLRQITALRSETRLSIRVLVGIDGRPEKVEIARTSGHPELDRFVQAHAMRLRFRPALNNGVPVRVYAAFPIILR